jgi:hypothetical protein
MIEELRGRDLSLFKIYEEWRSLVLAIQLVKATDTGRFKSQVGKLEIDIEDYPAQVEDQVLGHGAKIADWDAMVGRDKTQHCQPLNGQWPAVFVSG